MEDTKIQWHPGFIAAMNLEFKDNREPDTTFILAACSLHKSL